MRSITLLLMACLLSLNVMAQRLEKNTEGLIQFSGVVMDAANSENLEALPFVNVALKGTPRGTYSDWNGFFTIVAKKGQVVVFSAVGYKTVEYTIPNALEEDRYSLVQLMTRDEINLPETVVFPWPSKEHFRLEFLAMDVNRKLEEIATENLGEKALEEMRETLAADGGESGNYYLRQQAAKTYYNGQTRPMNILNVFAWQKFIKAWKDGDFKKKKDKKKSKNPQRLY